MNTFAWEIENARSIANAPNLKFSLVQRSVRNIQRCFHSWCFSTEVLTPSKDKLSPLNATHHDD